MKTIEFVSCDMHDVLMAVVLKGQRQARMLKDLPPVYSNQPSSYSYVLGGYAAGGRTHTQELFIPNHRIGSIIGKAGSRINGIRYDGRLNAVLFCLLGLTVADLC